MSKAVKDQDETKQRTLFDGLEEENQLAHGQSAETMLPHEIYRTLAEKVRKKFRGVRLELHRGPRQRQMPYELKSEAAELLEASQESFSLTSILFDQKEPVIRGLNRAFREFQLVFHSPRYTLPFPMTATRLILESAFEDFEAEMQKCQEILQDAVEKFSEEFPALVQRQKERRGRAFEESDYRFDPRSEFRARHIYVNLEPPSYLMRLDPKIYERQEAIVKQQFEQAVLIREHQLAEQFLKSVKLLEERLRGDGESRGFRISTVENLQKAMEEIRSEAQRTGIGDGPLLQAAEELNALVSGRSSRSMAHDLKNDESYKNEMQKRLHSLQETLSSLMVAAPRRRLSPGFGS